MKETVVAFERGPRGKKYTPVIQTHAGWTRRTSFGASGYEQEQYRDSTGMRGWSHKDHGDSKR